MSAPSPSPVCPDITSAQLLQFVVTNFFKGCAQYPGNPVCAAVSNAMLNPKPSLKVLADELHKIKESDMVTYLEGPGLAQAQMIATSILMPLKCFTHPSKSERKMRKEDINALSKIKSWYIDKYVHSFGKAKIPGVDFTTTDARRVRESADKLVGNQTDNMW